MKHRNGCSAGTSPSSPAALRKTCPSQAVSVNPRAFSRTGGDALRRELSHGPAADMTHRAEPPCHALRSSTAAFSRAGTSSADAPPSSLIQEQAPQRGVRHPPRQRAAYAAPSRSRLFPVPPTESSTLTGHSTHTCCIRCTRRFNAPLISL